MIANISKYIATWLEWNSHAWPPMMSAIPIYIGLRTKRCSPITTSFFGGAIGAGVPPPMNANPQNAVER